MALLADDQDAATEAALARRRDCNGRCSKRQSAHRFAGRRRRRAVLPRYSKCWSSNVRVGLRFGTVTDARVLTRGDCSSGLIARRLLPTTTLRCLRSVTLLIIQVVDNVHPACRKRLVQDLVVPSMECGPEELDDRRWYLRHGFLPWQKVSVG